MKRLLWDEEDSMGGLLDILGEYFILVWEYVLLGNYDIVLIFFEGVYV